MCLSEDGFRRLTTSSTASTMRCALYLSLNAGNGPRTDHQRGCAKIVSPNFSYSARQSSTVMRKRLSMMAINLHTSDFLFQCIDSLLTLLSMCLPYNRNNDTADSGSYHCLDGVLNPLAAHSLAGGDCSLLAVIRQLRVDRLWSGVPARSTVLNIPALHLHLLAVSGKRREEA